MEHDRLRHYFLSNTAYILTTNVAKRRRFFLDVRYVRILESVMQYNAHIKDFSILAYVIMPDHLHILLYARETTISEIMRSVKTNSSREINRLLCGRGSKGSGRGGATPSTVVTPPIVEFQWQDGFHDHMIRDEQDFWYHIEYIKSNPVAAGLVDCPEEYPFLFVDNEAAFRILGY